MLISCDQVFGPDRSRTDTMNDVLEASSQRLCHHLRKPLAGRGDLLNETAGNTVTETVPIISHHQLLVWRAGWRDDHHLDMGLLRQCYVHPNGTMQ